jgi:hypothetical protein
MNCKLCFTSNDLDATFCRNCGGKLNLVTQKLEKTDPIAQQAINHLFTYIMIECLILVMWLLFSNVVIPILNRSDESSSLVMTCYDYWGFFVNFISITTAIVFISITKHPKARLAFIIALVVRFMVIVVPYILTFLRIK